MSFGLRKYVTQHSKGGMRLRAAYSRRKPEGLWGEFDSPPCKPRPTTDPAGTALTAGIAPRAGIRFQHSDGRLPSAA
jgi:hypothetical protein